MPLTAVAPGLWATVHTMHMAGAEVTTRMSVVRLEPDGLLVHSPVPIDDALAAELAALGKIRFVVAPSRHHTLFVAPFMARFPGAALYAASGLEKKWPGLTPAGILSDGTSVPWGAEVERVFLAGAPGFSESVFFHRASRSLLESDLLFNVPGARTFGTRLMLRVMGVYRRLAPSRAWLLLVKDKRAFKASVEKVLEWDFVRIVPGHGDVLEASGVRARARQALKRYLDG